MGWLVTAAIAGLLCVLFILNDFCRHSVFSRRGIAGPGAVPFIGTYEIFRDGFPKSLMNFQEKYGKCYGIYLFSRAQLVVGDADMLREILVKNFNNFVNRINFPLKDYPMNQGVNVLKGERWQEVRNTLTPAFSGNKMKKIAIIINETCDQLIENFEEKRKEPFIQCKDMFGSFAMDVVAAAFFGLQIDSMKNKNHVFVVNAHKAFQTTMKSPVMLMITIFPFMAPFFNFLGIGVFPVDVKKFFSDVVIEMLELREKEKDYDRVDILQLMLNAHNLPSEPDEEESSDRSVDTPHADADVSKTSSSRRKPLELIEIIANCFIFFVAGYETTNTALCFAAYLLANNPKIQEKLIQEVDKKAPSRDDVTYDIMSSMEYLNCVVMETLRIYPPAPSVDRTSFEACSYKGLDIHPGDTLLIPIYAIHHNEEYWPEPEKFDPDRFNKENREKNHPYAYMPFGNGPRNCLGMHLALMEIKFALVRLLQMYRFQTCADTQIPPKLRELGIICPDDGVKVQVVPRSDKKND